MIAQRLRQRGFEVELARARFAQHRVQARVAIADQADEPAEEDVAVAQLGHAFALPGFERRLDVFGRGRVAIDDDDLAAGARQRHCGP